MSDLSLRYGPDDPRDLWENITPVSVEEFMTGTGFPFPLADPVPEPMLITRPCGCTFMELEPGGTPAQVSWCVPHDPGYTP